MDTRVFDTKYTKLNTKQKEAVDTIYGPVMVIAGPGTGKTTVLTLRIANILRQTDAKPDEILAITFTEAGVKAMREKLREIIGDLSFRVNIFTFHSFANFMRARYPESFQKIGGRIPCNEIDQIEIIEEIFNEESFRELRVSSYGVKMRDITKRISDLKRELITPEKLLLFIKIAESDLQDTKETETKKTKTAEKNLESKEKYIVRLKEFLRVFERYEAKLEEKGLYDFDDTILGLIDALSLNKEMQMEMRETFQFVLADEHQDANGAQNEILKFFKDKDSRDDPNLFIVGDDKQSIFRFQGASLDSFFAFRDEFPKAKKIDLEDNYRSHKIILDASHSLISQGGGSHTKLRSNVLHEEKPIEICEFDSERDEFEMIAKNIKEIIDSNKDGTVAVLSRNNTTLFRFAPFLDALNIPYNLKGEISVFDTLEYKKISSLFVALTDPLNSGDFIKSILFGFFKSNIRDILVIQDSAIKRRKSFGEVFLGSLKDLDLDDRKGVLELQKTLINIIDLSKKKPLLEFLKILKEHIVLVDKSELYEVLKSLFDEAEQLVLKKRHVLLSDFVAHLQLIEKHAVSPIVQLEESNARVSLSSIHKSKGLEYDAVFIIGVTSKNFEQKSRKNDLLQIPGIGIQKELAEERRLLYVAITRAKKHALISFSLCSLDGGELLPSILLDEIDPSLVQRRKVETRGDKIDLLSAQKSNTSDLKAILKIRFLERNFSVTALNNYLECPYKYVFRNLLQIPDIKEFSALLGTACHEVLRRFHLLKKKGEPVSKKDVLKMIEEEVTSLPFSKRDLSLALEKATENIEAYVSAFTDFASDEQIFVEESLSFPLTFVSGKEKAEILVNGKIDLAVKSGDRIKVIDFKSKKRMTPNEIKGLTKTGTGNEYRQLQFYKLLWQSVYDKDTVNCGSLVFLTPERGKILSEDFVLNDDDLNNIKNMLDQVLPEIYSGEFLDKHCDDEKCEYCRSGLI